MVCHMWTHGEASRSDGAAHCTVQSSSASGCTSVGIIAPFTLRLYLCIPVGVLHSIRPLQRVSAMASALHGAATTSMASRTARLPAARCRVGPAAPLLWLASQSRSGLRRPAAGDAEPQSTSTTVSTQDARPAASAPQAALQEQEPAASSSAPPLLKGQGTAIVTGAISVIFGVAYLVLVQLLDMRGGELLPPPPEAFIP